MASYNELFGLGTHSEDASLEGWWPLQDDAASTTVVDQSSSSDNGTLSGGDNTADITSTGPNSWLAKGLRFNGTDDLVKLPNLITAEISALSSGGSVLARFNTDQITGDAGLHMVFALRENNRIYLAHEGSDFYSRLNGSSDFGTKTLSTATWYNGSIVWDGSGNGESFVDSVSAGTTTGLSWSTPSSNESSRAIGAYWRSQVTSFSDSYFDGIISDVSFWQRDLSETELDEWENGPEPINSVAPALSGTETQGQTLSCTTGTWVLDSPFASGSNGTVTYAYQWTRSNDAAGTGEANIGGATSSTYTLTASDVGKFIRCVVAASNDGGNDSAADTNSDMSGAIASGFQPAWASRSNVIMGLT